MKKALFTLLCSFTLTFIASCSSDDGVNDDAPEVYQNGAGVIETAGPQVISLPQNINKVIAVVGTDTSVIEVPNHKLTIKSNSYNIMQLFDENNTEIQTVALKAAKSDIDVSKKNTEFDVSSFGQDFINKIPEKGNNGDKFPVNFAYTSKGESFNIYPIYSNTANKVTLGIFWYDESNAVKTQDIWQMDDEWYAKGTHMDSRPYHYQVKAQTSKGVNIYVPRGVTFGFYVYTHKDANKRCSDASQNNCISQKPHVGKTAATHALTYTEGKYTFLGFEDGHSDSDYNDLVLLIDPEQEIMENPTPEKIEEKKEELQEDETTYVVKEDYIHTTIHNPYVDVEARLKEPYPYFRLNLPVEKNKNLEIDLSVEFGEFITAQDDLRIAGANDETIAYIKDNETYSGNGITIINNYPIVRLLTSNTVTEGIYTLKIEGSPAESQFNNLLNKIKQIFNNETNWSQTIKDIQLATVPAKATDIVYWDENLKKLIVDNNFDTSGYYKMQVKKTMLEAEYPDWYTDVSSLYVYIYFKQSLADGNMSYLDNILTCQGPAMKPTAGNVYPYIFTKSVNGNGVATYCLNPYWKNLNALKNFQSQVMQKA